MEKKRRIIDLSKAAPVPKESHTEGPMYDAKLELTPEQSKRLYEATKAAGLIVHEERFN